MYEKRKERLRIAAIYILAGIVVVFLLVYFGNDQAGAARQTENQIELKPQTFSQEYRNRKGEVRLVLSFQYPNITGNYNGIDRVNCRYTTLFSNWLKEQEELIDSVPDDLATNTRNGNEVSYTVTYNKNKIISVLFEGYLYTGGAHGMPYRIPTNLNLDTGKDIDLTETLGKSKEEIKKMVNDAFARLVKKDKDAYFENAKDVVEKTDYDDLKYYFTSDNIVFYFDPYILAPFAAGFVEIPIEY